MVQGTSATRQGLERLSDEQLVEQTLAQSGAASDASAEILYKRYYARVAFWCNKFCSNPETAADVAQEVFLRVHTRLHTFRRESSFATWLYAVTRSVAINREKQARRYQQSARLDLRDAADPQPDAEALFYSMETSERLQRALRSELDDLEAQVVYLHFVDGMSLNAITELLSLSNKSGAKAYLVAGLRKLRRRLGRQLSAVPTAAAVQSAK